MPGGPVRSSCVVGPEYPENGEDYWPNRPTIAWVQATDLGVAAVSDNDERTLGHRPDDGTPIEGVTVGDSPGGETATTGADGLAGLAW